MKLAKCLCLSIFICMLSALLFYIGGFDFNVRNPDVAFGVFMTLVFAIFIPSAAFFM